MECHEYERRRFRFIVTRSCKHFFKHCLQLGWSVFRILFGIGASGVVSKRVCNSVQPELFVIRILPTIQDFVPRRRAVHKRKEHHIDQRFVYDCKFDNMRLRLPNAVGSKFVGVSQQVDIVPAVSQF